MNWTTFASSSVAHRVAFRELTSEELSAIESKNVDMLDRVNKAMSRVIFIDELRYSTQLDLTDLLQCHDRSTLETYLLCTCLFQDSYTICIAANNSCKKLCA